MPFWATPASWNASPGVLAVRQQEQQVQRIVSGGKRTHQVGASIS